MTYDSAYSLVHRTKEELLTKNRFFVNEQFNKLLESVIDECCINENDKTLFRARIYEESDVFDIFRGRKEKEGDFKGYNAENSFVNTSRENSNVGRANPKGIIYLYVSDKKETACLEVCNKKDVAISIATVEITESLRILDLSRDGYVTGGSVENKGIVELLNAFKCALADEMNRPVINEDGYILTQYICEYVKNRGIDGIKYKSTSRNNSKNYVIFNYDKCKVISSDLYRVKNIDIEIDRFPTKKCF